MNERAQLEAWSAGLFLAALVVGGVLTLPSEGSLRERPHPSHAAELERSEAGEAKALHLTEGAHAPSPAPGRSAS